MEQQQILSMIEMQFHAQHEHYRTHFPNADFDIILLNDKPIGRLYANNSLSDKHSPNTSQFENELRLIDIALLPEFRNCGIGACLIRELQDRAVSLRLPVRLRVEPNNPALRLYERMGFRCIADEGINLHLEWSCGPI